ncbi:metallophosphoesterase family protein [Azospirillum halopraeferens]|uniref:metallophosphoesterase family protein n=1 Tax=Azospirillum halopraeferens TaxID=34010 RepID=UPI0004070E63|nr:metallophosphoesterase family protein [Azospirillum halopraeferens]
MMGRFFPDGLFGFRRARPRRTAAPRVPDGLRVYAVADIHGRRDALDRLIALVAEDAADAAERGLTPVMVFLGDYVDRGADSYGVLDRLCRPVIEGVACRFLLGNHEAALLEFLEAPAAGAEWLDYGGVETLGSYGVRASVGIRERARCEALRDRFAGSLPDAHLAFLKSLEPMVVLGDYAFVHAGIRPGRSLERQRLDDLLWIREPFLSDPRPHDKVVVHGHTMVDQPDLRDNRIGIDTGAYVTGVLTTLVLQEDQQCLIQARA